jgi:hypothetical protein
MYEKLDLSDPDQRVYAPGGGGPQAYHEPEPSVREGFDRTAGRAVVDLIVELEYLARIKSPPNKRIALLKVLEPRVLKTGEGLPSFVALARQSQGNGTGRQSLAQRLYRLLSKNLKMTLEDFDCSPLVFADAAGDQRSWLVRSLFRLFGREVEYSVQCNRAWPPSMWREIHDLYLYLSSRRDIDFDTDDTIPGGAFDPEQEYKRLLLLGLVKEFGCPMDPSSTPHRSLRVWARESLLHEPRVFAGTFNLCVVDIFCDEPPRQHAAALDPGFSGWVLEPAQGFLDYCADCATFR